MSMTDAQLNRLSRAVRDLTVLKCSNVALDYGLALNDGDIPSGADRDSFLLGAVSASNRISERIKATARDEE